MSSINQIQNEKAVYGPVKSWRFGWSLGIDPIFEISTCSFNCIYCQLGNIQKVTTERKVYVSTEKVISDFKDVLASGSSFDVITFSGSGEPTLATNLGEIVSELKVLSPQTPILVLTNSTMLHLPEVQENLKNVDRVIVKLDAPNDEILQMMNRPAEGVSINSILEGILAFQKVYKGELDIQMMFMPLNLKEIDDLAGLLKQIQPEVVQLNTPLRPYPLSWHRDSRGNHYSEREYEVRTLRVITKEEATFIEETLRAKTGLKVLSVYRE
ncbi:MAG: radical SAM protein [Candidatus Caenarcaniphilales bacterium]|nr:radical SAM protein [Candidatus Caenarcaniphilales bacterium]